MSVNEIEVRKNGPLLCRGDVEVRDAAGNLLEHSDDVALCRCGLSDLKPFCDGTHKKIGFEASGLLHDEKPEALEGQGPLQVTVRNNAMLVFKGPMRIVGSEGGATTRNKAALCRCGQSERKPFCDVSHKTCGFKAE
ncbi:MAG TPA: CDGSH iron-sulfur domain-containing protein [Gammaproteobacteria bacterium]|nr:CDGSH iron-sulfur domain-containing protein [Gammaproteobacteria bacterium]